MLISAQWPLPELEEFVAQALVVQAKRRAPSLSSEETTLLQKINRGLPPVLQTRFTELDAKRRAETLTPAEHRELLELIAKIEQFDVERVTALGELARLRKVSLRTLMKQLGIRRAAYA
jgi:hypothetical protein